MSSILSEELIKSSIGINKQSANFTLSEIELLIDKKITEFYSAMLRDQIQRINKIEDENTELKETIAELKEFIINSNQNNDSYQDDSNTTTSRANRVYPELCKKGKLSTADIKRICKIKHYSGAYRIIEKVVELYPNECIIDKGTSGTGKKWLALKNYQGF